MSDGTGRPVEIIGVASGAGANRVGIEEGTGAMLAAGFVEALRAKGVGVLHDPSSDPPKLPWTEEAISVEHSNGEGTVRAAGMARERVRAAIEAGRIPVLLGGDCTIEVGAVAGLLDAGRTVGLVYVDAHADLNVPGAVPEAKGEFALSLDWMGVAHMLDMDGAYRPLAAIGPRRPLLTPDRVGVLGWVEEQASEFEKERIGALDLHVLGWERVLGDPEGAARAVLGGFGVKVDALAVHFDVDVLDQRETEVADTSASRGIGLTRDAARAVLATLARDPRFASLTIAEVNPTLGDRRDGVAAVVGLVADALAGSGSGT